jgi:hypothetical protein
MSINPYLLKKGREYIVISNNRNCRGTFIRMTCFTVLIKSIKNSEEQFMHYDKFYDVEDIKFKANNARQNMEKRALDTILKKIVNENFEW